MAPFFTSDALVLGLLVVVLALIFWTSSLDHPGWKKFYTYVPSLLLCCFIPAFLNWPLGLIAPHWYESGVLELALQYGAQIDASMSYDAITEALKSAGVPAAEYKALQGHSQLYYISSRFLLPASLVLLCLGIDFQGVLNLGPKALIMFFAATVGIILGGPIALLLISYVSPDVIPVSADELWRGLSTVAGSWIGGGANQTAMKEIFDVSDNLFGTMIVVDVVVANIWMGFLLYGANISDRLDEKLKADNSAIEDLKRRVSEYSAKVARIPNTTDVFIMLGVAFGSVALAHWGRDVITPWMSQFRETLEAMRLNSLMSGFFWLIVISTTIGLALSFTRARSLEGVGATRWGSIFIYVLVATIGRKMNIGEV